jgi:RNA polymerase sigma-70 factor, ECF subfamily
MTSSRNDFFAQLFSESREVLQRYIRRLVGSRETAEEIVQEAFLRTYEHGDVVETPRAFLFSTARNLAFNQYRHRQIAERESLVEADDSRVPSQCESLESEALRNERTRLINDAVNRLPPQCRAAFSLRVFHGCSYKEVADRLGISAKTVEKHIARGLRETHVYMKRRYGDPSERHG